MIRAVQAVGFYPEQLAAMVAIGAGGAILCCVFVVLHYRRKTRQVMNRLDDMTEAAIDGTFSEKRYDETQMSRLESKLHRFLSGSVSAKSSIEQEKDKIKTLISDISHQTKTPMANIKLYEELVWEQQELPESCKPLMKQIGEQTEKLNFLIQALVKTSRLEGGIVQVAPKSQPVESMLWAAVAEAGKHAEAKGVSLLYKGWEKEMPYQSVKGELKAVFDRKWTLEAIYNILDNAIKYTSPGGSVTVSVQDYELFCRIDIADTGIGISEMERAKIFGRFYRSSAVAEQEGLGIGLFLAREIVTAQGGYIKVSSQVAEGSVFSVFLPRCAG